MGDMKAILRIIQFLAWPYHAISDAIELRQLRREFPNAHRHLVQTSRGAMPESDALYLDRLRDFYWDREAEATARIQADQSEKATSVDLCGYWPRARETA
jgi:hypothetical protein